MAQSKWIYGGGAVLLAGLIVWAVTSVPEIPQQTDEPTGPRIMSYMDNTLHEERDGRTIWQMTAEQMNVDIDTNDTGMVKIDGTFYSDDGRTLTLKADEGRMDSKTRDIVHDRGDDERRRKPEGKADQVDGGGGQPYSRGGC